jgi:hypothetical protein
MEMFSQQEMEERSKEKNSLCKAQEFCKAQGEELADMNAANTVLKTQLERALADVKDLQQQTVDRHAINEELHAAMNKELQEAEAARNQSFKTLQAQKTENDNCKRSMAELEERLSEVCKAHEKELAGVNAENAVLKDRLEKALAGVKDLQQQMQHQVEETSNESRELKTLLKEAQESKIKLDGVVHALRGELTERVRGMEEARMTQAKGIEKMYHELEYVSGQLGAHVEALVIEHQRQTEARVQLHQDALTKLQQRCDEKNHACISEVCQTLASAAPQLSIILAELHSSREQFLALQQEQQEHHFGQQELDALRERTVFMEERARTFVKSLEEAENRLAESHLYSMDKDKHIKELAMELDTLRGKAMELTEELLEKQNLNDLVIGQMAQMKNQIDVMSYESRELIGVARSNRATLLPGVKTLLKETQRSKSELEDLVHALRSELSECVRGVCVGSRLVKSARLRYESELLKVKASYEWKTRDGVKFVSNQLGAHVEALVREHQRQTETRAQAHQDDLRALQQMCDEKKHVCISALINARKRARVAHLLQVSFILLRGKCKRHEDAKNSCTSSTRMDDHVSSWNILSKTTRNPE